MNALANDMERGDCTLVEVTTSYGCGLVAVADVPASEVQVSEQWRPRRRQAGGVDRVELPRGRRPTEDQVDRVVGGAKTWHKGDECPVLERSTRTALAHTSGRSPYHSGKSPCSESKVSKPGEPAVRVNGKSAGHPSTRRLIARSTSPSAGVVGRAGLMVLLVRACARCWRIGTLAPLRRADDQLAHSRLGAAGLEPVDAFTDQIEPQRVAPRLLGHRHVDRDVGPAASGHRMR